MKKQDLKALLEEAEGKKILFLGKEGIFTTQEVERFLKKYKVTRVKGIEEGVVASVEHHSLNPVEEMISEDAYARKIPAYRLEEFEQLLSDGINDDELLMAIKLSNDQARVLRMIQNPDISDALFVKLLEMYQWHEEEEDNNDDRSVVIATLTRYIDITPAERDQLYSTLTLKRLVREATDPRLLHALIGFPNYAFKQKEHRTTSLYEVIATSGHIDGEVIKRLLSLRNPKVDMYLAANPVVPLEQLKKFSLREEKSIHEALAANETIDDALFEMLLEKEKDVVKLLLWYQPISAERYRMVAGKITDPELFAELGKNLQIDRAVIEELLESGNIALLEKLAANRSMPAAALRALYSMQIGTTFYPLAGNPNLPVELIEGFYANDKNDLNMMHQVASNPNTPEKILRELYARDELEINKGLAANPATPIEILDVLKIDTRLRNALTKNEVFVEHHNTTKVVI
ncbi:hypothetical protein [Sulfurovum sp.]|jgi:hypothetical protein|uniref:hypothetical protein n=1 Tax=Sulfurovum sp. TaxID=1969726 RepID=UPI002A36AF95|nr:hypothetical protein [Sulfurovum sp.]MDD2451192.1 hypothetical protein [Sulfurovum sp.]MDD3499663.1 hypothetical protein [Sulfurovum sp.]MDY0402222.1 hypothetical protein [Sulfurovum sp.]